MSLEAFLDPRTEEKKKTEKLAQLAEALARISATTGLTSLTSDEIVEALKERIAKKKLATTENEIAAMQRKDVSK